MFKSRDKSKHVIKLVTTDSFTQELDMLRKLQTVSNVIKLIDSSEGDRYCYPFIIFPSAGEVLTPDMVTKWDQNTHNRIKHDIVDALKEIHTLGVLHRDVRPSNLMYDGTKVTVIDFGLTANG